MSDEYLQAVAAIAAVILQRNTTGPITEEDVLKAVLIADKGLTAGAREAQGLPVQR
ncbi:hypothetical protein [Acidovorax sp.]|uniref:hypothetical protein n=1 Tax=Acidovorax sp. TaxID=1872122 RepID=UPI0031D63712